MLKYTKYEFPSELIKNQFIESLFKENKKDLIDEVIMFVDLNKIVLTPPKILESNILEPAVFSSGFCVDVKWKTQKSTEWSEYEINPTTPKHKM